MSNPATYTGDRLGEMWRAPIATKVFWALRVGVALEFIGHGMAGLWRSPAWLPYFTVFGFSKEFSHDHLYYVTGTVDITLAVLTLVRPMRAVLLHMTVWGFFTATLRPIVGESFFELVERGANYGMPAAFLLLAGWGTWSLRSWFEKLRAPEEWDETLATRLGWTIRASIALLLAGHGGMGIWAHKPEWVNFFGWFGISPATVAARHLSQWVGVFEIALGLAVLIKPLRSLLLFVLVWKLGTELLRPLVGQNNYQVVERAGDFVLPITLIWIVTWLRVHLGRDERTAVPAAWQRAPAAVHAPVHAPAPVGAGAGVTVAERPEVVDATPDPELVAAARALTSRLAAERSRQ